MSSPTPPEMQQQNNGAGTSVSPAVLSSLMHFLQLNKMLWGCSAPNAMPTYANATAAQPQQMTTTTTEANDNLQPNFKPEINNKNCGNAPQQNANANNGMDATKTTSALFAKTVDSLHSFLSPNVVLLPVAFHSLADEQHIQLLGMPQTVIPIAIHPQMQKQFAVRPLLLDQAMAHQLLQSVPKHIGIGWPPSVDSGGGNQSPHLGNHPHFQLPVTFRPSLDHPPTIAQNAQRSPDNKQQSSVIPAAMENVSADNEHSKGEQQLSAPSAVGKFEDGGDDQCKMAEPLDLSLSSARTKENESGSAMGEADCATVTGTIQRRKRTNSSSREPSAEEMCEIAAVTECKTMRKEITPAESEALPILAGCQITVSGFMGTDRVEIGRLVESYGGVFTGQMSRATCTHLIAVSKTGEKYKRACEWGTVHIVTKQWLDKCIETGHRLPEKNFLLDSNGDEKRRSSTVNEWSASVKQRRIDG